MSEEIDFIGLGTMGVPMAWSRHSDRLFRQARANPVAFLASPRVGYITGTVIPVDGGMHYFAH